MHTVPEPDTAAQRTSRARRAAKLRWAFTDPVEGTAKARAASPASRDYWERQVDPEGLLPEAERIRRAERAKQAHFIDLGLRSGRARRAKSQRVT